MVKISSSGDIIPDDAPNTNRPPGGRLRQGRIQHEEVQRAGSTGSIFTDVNQKLREMGIPTWNLGSYMVEPIVSVAAVIAVLFLGLPGLLLVALLFIVSKWSEGPSTSAPSGGSGQRGGGGPGRGWGTAGSGNVLGRR